MARRYVWIVELQFAEQWEATVGAYLSREDARMAKKEWGPNSRIRKYVPSERKERG